MLGNLLNSKADRSYRKWAEYECSRKSQYKFPLWKRKGLEQGYLLINIILIMCAISILKAGSLSSSVANVILRLLVGQFNISVKYEIFNDTKQQAGRTTHAPEKRSLAANNWPLRQLSLQSNHSGPGALDRILTGHQISPTQLPWQRGCYSWSLPLKITFFSQSASPNPTDFPAVLGNVPWPWNTTWPKLKFGN